MFDESIESSPASTITTLDPLDPDWQPILHASNQVVLYNPTSHALSVQRHLPPQRTASVVRRTLTGGRCPYCHRRLSKPRTLGGDGESDGEDIEDISESDAEEIPRARAPNYFQLLQVANESASVPPTPRSSSPSLDSPGPSLSPTNEPSGPFRAGNMAEGYFMAFFREECRLGMGANGSVFLCQHVLDGNLLGHFAVKKIAVGQSHSYLINILQEIRLLEKLHHPNIITYHHAWLETCQFSSFGPKVPTLHVLMQWAEGGSLDDFIDARLGRSPPPHIAHMHPPGQPLGPTPPAQPQSSEVEPSTSTPYSRSARIRAFRELQRAPPEERERLRREMALSSVAGQRSNSDAGKGSWLAIHLLSAEEVKSLFLDVVEGLAFLHDKSILHLDLKPGNVLLTWDEGNLIPRAMLSDFGTSQDMLNSRTRSGNTGTLEYTSPESLPTPTGRLQQIDSKSDMWSLGMILHKLLFFRLPYRHASDNIDQSSRRDGKEAADQLEAEVRTYPGFKSSQNLVAVFRSRRLPQAFLILLERLLNAAPSSRPSSERVLGAIREGNFDPETLASQQTRSKTSLVPILRRGNVTSEGHTSTSLTESQNGRIEPVDVAQEHDQTTPTNAEHPARVDGKVGADGPIHSLPALPSPVDDNGMPLTLISPHDPARSRVSLLLSLRILKSCVLVVKVLTLSAMCADNRVVKSLALVLAAMDTWFDGLRISLVLGLIHIVLVRWMC